MAKIFSITFLSAFLGFMAFWVYPYLKRDWTDRATELYLQESDIIEIGQGSKNVVGIQPFMLPHDYRTPEKFEYKIAGYLREALKKGWIKKNTTVVLPEYVGAWLVAVNQNPWVYQMKTIQTAMAFLILGNPVAFFKASRGVERKDFFRETIFRMRAKAALAAYVQVFSKLAKDFQVTLVAGSIVLPEIEWKSGEAEFKNGKTSLHNNSMVFGPNGDLIRIIRKVHLVDEEEGFLMSAGIDFGQDPKSQSDSLGVLICADSWFPNTYQKLFEKNSDQRPIDLVVVPAFHSQPGIRTSGWGGYENKEVPSDVDLKDIGRITEWEAWNKYALPGRLRQAKIKNGMVVFLRGDLWDLHNDGAVIWANGRSIDFGPFTEFASMVNAKY